MNFKAFSRFNSAPNTNSFFAKLLANSLLYRTISISKYKTLIRSISVQFYKRCQMSSPGVRGLNNAFLGNLGHLSFFVGKIITFEPNEIIKQFKKCLIDKRLTYEMNA